jgi:hypothetical protein
VDLGDRAKAAGRRRRGFVQQPLAAPPDETAPGSGEAGASPRTRRLGRLFRD